MGQSVHKGRRAEVLSRDGYCCRYFVAEDAICAARDALTVHHVRPRRNGGSQRLDNLVVVCRKHHNAIERDVDERLYQHSRWENEWRVGSAAVLAQAIAAKPPRVKRSEMPTPRGVVRRAEAASPRFAGAVLNRW